MDTPTAVTLLRETRALLASPERWTQGTYAKNRSGRPLVCTDSEVTCWCLLGAVYHCSIRLGRNLKTENAALHLLQRAINANRPDDDWLGIAEWQDAPERTHAEVLALIDRAMGLVEAQEATHA